jgi:hypothetical protein
MPSPLKNTLLIGVGRMSHVEGGLLMELADEDNGGVAGAYRISEKSVSSGWRNGESCCWMRMVGFWYIGCGDATGVMSGWFAYEVLGYWPWEPDDDGRWNVMLDGQKTS